MDKLITESTTLDKRELSQAIALGDTRFIHYWLSKGRDIDDQDDEGNTILHHAARKGAISLVIYLLKHQASIFIKNKRGRTALLEAYATHHSDIVRAITLAAIEKSSIKSIFQNYKGKDVKSEKKRGLVRLSPVLPRTAHLAFRT